MDATQIQQWTDTVGQLATKEVITVLAALAVAWTGWKTASKGWGVASNFAQKASFMGLTATLLILGGLGATGFGVGELTTRMGNDQEIKSPEEIAAMQEASTPGLKNKELIELLKSDSTVSTELTKEVLAYARSRDGQVPDTELLKLAEKNPEHLPVVIDLLKAREVRLAKQVETNRDNLQTKKGVVLTSLDQKPEGEQTEVQLVEAEKPKKESLVTPQVAWMNILFGIGSVISGFVVFLCRNATPNPHDPHHQERAARTAEV